MRAGIENEVVHPRQWGKARQIDGRTPVSGYIPTGVVLTTMSAPPWRPRLSKVVLPVREITATSAAPIFLATAWTVREAPPAAEDQNFAASPGRYRPPDRVCKAVRVGVMAAKLPVRPRTMVLTLPMARASGESVRQYGRTARL